MCEGRFLIHEGPPTDSLQPGLATGEGWVGGAVDGRTQGGDEGSGAELKARSLAVSGAPSVGEASHLAAGTSGPAGAYMSSVAPRAAVASDMARISSRLPAQANPLEARASPAASTRTRCASRHIGDVAFVGREVALTFGSLGLDAGAAIRRPRASRPGSRA